MSDDKDDDVDLSLLDKNLAEIEDLPSFDVWPKGNYVALISGGTKKINKHPAVVIDMELVTTVQLANVGDKPMPDGSKNGLMFMLDNEFGMGSMKKFLIPFAEFYGTDNVKTLVTEKIQNTVVSFTMDHQQDKDDKTKYYPRPKNIVIQNS